MNWPADETMDRQHTLRRTPLAQDTHLPPQHAQRDGEELDDIFSTQ